MKKHDSSSYRVLSCGLIAILQVVIIFGSYSSGFSQRSWEDAPPGNTNQSGPEVPQSPTVTLAEDVSDVDGQAVELKAAPFQIRVKGIAQNAGRLFVYLVVDDSHALHIQPVQSLGPNTDGKFTANCYLGIQNDPNSVRKFYRIFVVVTGKSYLDYSHLDKSTVLAQSKALELYRIK